jgi:hypothetical protein
LEEVLVPDLKAEEVVTTREILRTSIAIPISRSRYDPFSQLLGLLRFPS